MIYKINLLSGESFYLTGSNIKHFKGKELIHCIKKDNLILSTANIGNDDFNIEITPCKELENPSTLQEATIDILKYENKIETILFKGLILSSMYKEDGITLTISPYYKKLDVHIDKYFSTYCRAEFGDNKCKCDITKYTHEGIITDVLNDGSIVVLFDKEVNIDKLELGSLEIIEGSNINQKSRIINIENNQIYILPNFNKEEIQGNRVKLIEGCDKNFFTCRDSFSNVINFQGEPFLDSAINNRLTKEGYYKVTASSNNNKKAPRINNRLK